MPSFIELVGPTQAVQIFGLRLVGVNAENGKKLIITLVFVTMVILLGRLAHLLARWILGGKDRVNTFFWVRQAIKLGTAVIFFLGVVSIWFDDPTRLATALGLVTAGLAFALQKVVTAIAGYFVILRGDTFNVGDRITMGGVRGDVIALGFTQTTLMEMGQPPAVQNADPAMWVKSRQYTGRIVTITNSKVFDEPVYNYTREFPYIWEEISIPISYTSDRKEAERILLEATQKHTVAISSLSEQAIAELQRRYFVGAADLEPRVYFRLTDNWLELTVRFIVHDRGIREIKDQTSRDILEMFDQKGIGIASATFEIVGLPPLRLEGPERARLSEQQKSADH